MTEEKSIEVETALANDVSDFAKTILADFVDGKVKPVTCFAALATALVVLGKALDDQKDVRATPGEVQAVMSFVQNDLLGMNNA